MPSIGLIAGNGALPGMFARAARAKGYRVVAVGHRGETDPALESEVDRLHWVRVGRVAHRAPPARRRGGEAVLAGGFSRMRAWRRFARTGLFRIAAGCSFRDDALLRAAARVESAGVRIVAPPAS
jgi:DUF1009 family protein